ncbi:MAG: hypothetical protein Fur0041_10260 [Bacteroidia bacterium]
MQNGQLRFASYGRKGTLITQTPLHLGKFGNSNDCMACHAGNFSQLTVRTEEPEMGLSVDEYMHFVSAAQEKLQQYRKNKQTWMNFADPSWYAFAEVLQHTYTFPSVIRISGEWNTDTLTVKERLLPYQPEQVGKFAFAGKCYRRSLADSLRTP